MLTYMATISTLCDSEKLVMRCKPLLEFGQFPTREFYAFPGFVDWIKSEVKVRPTGRIASAMTPNEQLVQRLKQWVAGVEMAHGRMFHDMIPEEEAVWELKTADLRIFGWLCEPRKFVAVCGGFKDDYEEPTKIKYYGDDRDTVIAARTALQLDEPKFATGAFDELV